MKSNIFHKTLAIFMTFVVVFSTTSFTVAKHFCGDMLVEVAVLTEADTCGMESNVQLDNSCETIAKDCCTSVKNIKHGQDELSLIDQNFDDLDQSFLISFVASYQLLLPTERERASSYSDYIPPLVVKDIQKLDEVYLI